MIFIAIPSSMKDESNQWVTDSADRNGGNTFIVNKVDDYSNIYCVISLPDNGSQYTESMKEHFSDYVVENLDEFSDLPNNGI